MKRHAKNKVHLMKKFNLKMVDGYSAKEGVMKITKGAMVIMKGKQIGNLYKLLGNTVTGGAAASTSTVNRTLIENARYMRLNAGLPKNLLAEAVNYTCFVTNQSPSTVIDFKVPEEVWSSKPVDYSMLRIFGCPTYVHVQSGERLKLDSMSRKCICLGLECGVKGYRLWDPVSKKKIVSKDVVFDEAYMLRKGEDEASTDTQKGKQVVEVSLMNNVHSWMKVMKKNLQETQHREEPYSLARTGERPDRKASERYDFEDMVSFALIPGSGDPSSVQDGIPKEAESLQRDKTWESVELLKGKKAKACRWV